MELPFIVYFFGFFLLFLFRTFLLLIIDTFFGKTIVWNHYFDKQIMVIAIIFSLSLSIIIKLFN